jgi:hypothetical protein
MHARRVTMMIGWVLAFQVVVAAVQQPSAKSSLEGIVRMADSGAPLARAQVTLQSVLPAPQPGQKLSGAPASPPPIEPVVTQTDGRFSFKDLPSGQYMMRVSRNGYSTQQYGQIGEGNGAVITLSAGDRMNDVEFRMVAASNVGGRVRDAAGEPVAGVRVSLLRPVYTMTGQRSLVPGGSATTDDRGEYRISWASAGQYLLSVAMPTPSTGPAPPRQGIVSDLVFPTAYYPATLDPSSAKIIQLRPGADLNAIDVVLPQPRTYRIRGKTFSSVTGHALGTTSVSLLPRSTNGRNSIEVPPSGLALSYDKDAGTFEIRNVVPGKYWLRALGFPDGTSPNAIRLSSQMPVEVVSSDIDSLLLKLDPAVSIPIRVRLEGRTIGSIGGLDKIRVNLLPTLTGVGAVPQRTPFSPEGMAKLESVTAGEYRLQISLPPELYIKEARYGSADVLQGPLQVNAKSSGMLSLVLSSAGGLVEGLVSDSKSRPARNNTVVLVPDNGRDRPELYKLARADEKGFFSVQAIAPGNYKVFAWEWIDANAWLDPAIIARYEALGRPVSIPEFSKQTIQSRLIPKEQD